MIDKTLAVLVPQAMIQKDLSMETITINRSLTVNSLRDEFRRLGQERLKLLTLIEEAALEEAPHEATCGEAPTPEKATDREPCNEDARLKPQRGMLVSQTSILQQAVHVSIDEFRSTATELAAANRSLSQIN